MPICLIDIFHQTVMVVFFNEPVILTHFVKYMHNCYVETLNELMIKFCQQLCLSLTKIYSQTCSPEYCNIVGNIAILIVRLL